MKTVASRIIALASLVSLGTVTSALAENSAGIGKEWSKSGFGSNLTYKCKQPSCGAKSVMKVAKFGGFNEVPELGIPSGSNVEAEFRRRPEVRRILAAMLQQVVKESRNKGSSLTSAYFTKPEYVGFNFSAFDAKDGVYGVFQLRIWDNKALMIVSQGETAAVARRNLNALLPTIKTD